MPATQSATRRPPGPDHAVELGIDPGTLDTLTALQADYGNVIGITRPSGRAAYFVNDPTEVRRILVRHHARYHKGPGFERVKMLLGNGLIVSDGDVWRRSRTMIQPAFKVQNVHRLVTIMVACSDRRASLWAQAAAAGKTVNITQETSDFALELILRCIFGRDYEERLLTGAGNPFDFLSKESARDLGVVMKARQLRELLLDIVAARRSARADEFDFLSMYLQATDRDGRPFSDRELLDELMTLIVAGFETSANTLNWAWFLLADHPDVEARVLEEVRGVLPPDALPTAEHAARMTYTQQVLEETLRLYPPVWLFTRRAVADDTLADYDVPPGTDIYLSPYILHRTPEFWPAPGEFDPARFAGEESNRRERPYFPFSLGPRRCLGEYFSFLEMKLHLALLLPSFRMQRADATDPGLELGINLRSARDIHLRPFVRVAGGA
ncbi:MAG TPA: cytochrome P450 [Woeseiaceae bacterium]|nr:cytochrome P450 [Woeseiaceae bacterium]